MSQEKTIVSKKEVVDGHPLTKIGYIPQGEEFVVKYQNHGTKEELKTKDGIIIPDSASEDVKKEFAEQDDTFFEEVLAVGPRNQELKVGDMVAIRYPIAKNAKMGILLSIKGEEYVQFRGHEFIGKLQ